MRTFYRSRRRTVMQPNVAAAAIQQRSQIGWIALWIITVLLGLAYIVVVNANATSGLVMDHLSKTSDQLEREIASNQQAVAHDQSLGAIVERLDADHGFVAIDTTQYLGVNKSTVARAR